MPNERVLVIGAGAISNGWFPAIVAEQLDVVAVVDLNRETAQRQIDKYRLSGTHAMTDLDTALRDVRADFAIDLTIPDAHFAITTACLEAGLHVVGEKPMAATMDQARQLVITSERTGKLFMTSQSRRWDSNHASIAAAVRAGKLGTVTTVCCDFFIAAHFGGFREQMDSPLVLDMAIHHFDLARYFINVDAKRVWCHAFNPQGSWYEGNPAAICVFEMHDGSRFLYRGSWVAEGAPTSWNGDWRVIGTEGTLLYAADAFPTAHVVDRAAPPAFQLRTMPLAIEPVAVDAAGFHGALREMLRFLRTGITPQTECHDNIRSLAMVHAAMDSGRKNGWVEI